MTVSISVVCSPLLEGVTPLELVMLEGSGLMGIHSGGYEHLKEEFIRAGNDWAVKAQGWRWSLEAGSKSQQPGDRANSESASIHPPFPGCWLQQKVRKLSKPNHLPKPTVQKHCKRACALRPASIVLTILFCRWKAVLPTACGARTQHDRRMDRAHPSNCTQLHWWIFFFFFAFCSDVVWPNLPLSTFHALGLRVPELLLHPTTLVAAGGGPGTRAPVQFVPSFTDGSSHI